MIGHGNAPAAPDDVRAAKAILREQVLARRLSIKDDPMHEGQIASRLLDLVVGHRARAVAAHLGMPGEAATHEFVRRCPVPVWLPVIGADRSMGWARYVDDTHLTQHSWGMAQPDVPGQPHLPAEIDLVVMPALAADREGHRLGRGGGYYDRALADLSDPRPLLVAVVVEHDLLNSVPSEPHDVRVDVVVTPQQTLWCPPN